MVIGKWFCNRVLRRLTDNAIPGAARVAESPTRQTAGALKKAMGDTVPDADLRGESEVRRAGEGLGAARSRASPLDPRSWVANRSPAGVIAARSAELKLHTPARRALESSLLVDEPFLNVALVSSHPRPELVFGEKELAGYLDARAFTRRYGNRELTVRFMTDIHRRLSRFTAPETAVSSAAANDGLLRSILSPTNR
ncbi:hypothetical protein [Nocardia sp. CY41]|uniref:hypothetical protein n=1 Tax=Nocardia sp. CY41 TaxID=2608686 RepID=UPI00135B1D19|nr:hypothetical protein [Nocardia sp. CY41]